VSRTVVYRTLDEYERELPDLAQRLAGLNADVLKKMARVWVGKEAYKLNKESVIQTLKRCFNDAAAVRQAAANLTPAERDAVMLLKLRERPVAYTEELALELLLLHPLPPDKRGYSSYDQRHYERLNEMLERGLLMRCDGQSGSLRSYHSSYVCEAVGLVADFFDLIGIAPPPALPLRPVAEAVAPVARRAGEVLLQLTAFAQAFERLDVVPLTAKSLYANPALAKLSKLLGWGKQGDVAAALPAVEFYLGLFIGADLLKVDYRTREIAANPQINIQTTLEEPLAVQARRWAQGYRSLRRWKECQTTSHHYYDESLVGQTKYNGLRAALLLALGLLPDPAGWYAISTLSGVLRQRIGTHFALGYRPHYSVPWQATAEQEAAARAKYETELVASWQKNEHVWLTHALTGPLFHLGLVELARAPQDQPDEQTLFRLTEAGRAALYDIFRPSAARPSAAPASASEQPCWIVQPNFEVVVYLDQAAPRQLGFIERVGVRQSVAEAVVNYRLTRESVYAALEEGVEAQQLLQTLERGSRHPLPPGVARTLSDWAARRERLSLRLDASVLEFADAAARDAALAARQVKGAAIGERFLLVQESEAQLRRCLPLGGVVKYEPAPPRALDIANDGAVTINPAQHDLLIAGELAAVAEPTADPLRWRVTQNSVQAARGRGFTAEQILDRLDKRASILVPPFLRYAIKAWCGNKAEPGPTALSTPPLLQTANGEVTQAMIDCEFLRPHLLARIGSTALLVKPESVKELRRLLTEYGFTVGKDVLLPPPRKQEKK
jgi:hypothetical protein